MRSEARSRESTTPTAGASDVLTVPFAGAPIFTRSRALRPTGKVLPEHARSHNRALVLQTLYTAGAQSRADVARETGLTRVTISDLVAEPDRRGPRGRARPARGRPARQAGHAHRHRPRRVPDHRRRPLASTRCFRGAVIDLDGGIVARAEVALRRRHRRGRRRARRRRSSPSCSRARDDPGARHRRRLARCRRPARRRALGAQPRLGRRAPCRPASPPRPRCPCTSRTTPTSRCSPSTARPTSTTCCSSRSATASAPASSSAAGPVIGGGFAAGEIGHVVVGTDGGPRCACGKDGCLEAWLAAPRLTAQLAELDGDAAAASIRSRRDPARGRAPARHRARARRRRAQPVGGRAQRPRPTA